MTTIFNILIILLIISLFLTLVYAQTTPIKTPKTFLVNKWFKFERWLLNVTKRSLEHKFDHQIEHQRKYYINSARYKNAESIYRTLRNTALNHAQSLLSSSNESHLVNNKFFSKKAHQLRLELVQNIVNLTVSNLEVYHRSLPIVEHFASIQPMSAPTTLIYYMAEKQHEKLQSPVKPEKSQDEKILEVKSIPAVAKTRGADIESIEHLPAELKRTLDNEKVRQISVGLIQELLDGLDKSAHLVQISTESADQAGLDLDQHDYMRYIHNSVADPYNLVLVERGSEQSIAIKTILERKGYESVQGENLIDGISKEVLKTPAGHEITILEFSTVFDLKGRIFIGQLSTFIKAELIFCPYILINEHTLPRVIQADSQTVTDKIKSRYDILTRPDLEKDNDGNSCLYSLFLKI